jgi:cofilin
LPSPGSSYSTSTKYIIYKIADDKKSVVVDSVGKDQDYEVFRNELADAQEMKIILLLWE